MIVIDLSRPPGGGRKGAQMSNDTRYANLPTETPMGAPLDWAWLRGAKSEWGVQPKPGPRGLTMICLLYTSDAADE